MPAPRSIGGAMAADPADAAHAPRAPLRCTAAIPSPLSADFDALRGELKIP
jgi:hypothetical protein